MTGSDILALRRIRGWTQVELARRLGVSRLSIWRWETQGVLPLVQHQQRMRRWAREAQGKVTR